MSIALPYQMVKDHAHVTVKVGRQAALELLSVEPFFKWFVLTQGL